MPAAVRHADVDDLEGHQEVSEVHPKGAVVDARASELSGQAQRPLRAPVAPLARPLADTVGVPDPKQTHPAVLMRATVAQRSPQKSRVVQLSDVKDAVGVVPAQAHLLQLGVACRGAAHWKALLLELDHAAPQLLSVEAVLAEIDGLRREASEIQQRLRNFTAADGFIRAMRLGVSFLQQWRPQLLPICSAVRQTASVGSPLIIRARQPVIDRDGLPLPVQKEPQLVAAGGILRGLAPEQPDDQVRPLGHDGQRREEPAVADTALAEVLGAEAEVVDDDELGKPAPRHVRVPPRFCVRPSEEAAATRFAGPIRPAGVGTLLLDVRALRRRAAAAARGRARVLRGLLGLASVLAEQRARLRGKVSVLEGAAAAGGRGGAAPHRLAPSILCLLQLRIRLQCVVTLEHLPTSPTAHQLPNSSGRDS
mmetsp:Transcript_178512/g.572057  ORF Transcript_178512/g.572057 Transcript_178512/m.572057 type:complete len:423 (-) Transcript_178512:301-1569(-)